MLRTREEVCYPPCIILYKLRSFCISQVRYTKKYEPVPLSLLTWTAVMFTVAASRRYNILQE